MTLPCRYNPATGAMTNFSGQPVADCAQCDGCETGSFEQIVAVVGHNLSFCVVLLGNDYKLKWRCPGCGSDVYEDCFPIVAIPLSEEILKDPLCFCCRKVKLEPPTEQM